MGYFYAISKDFRVMVIQSFLIVVEFWWIYQFLFRDMGNFSKYLNRDMEYQGPPFWASDTDQYEKAHTVGLKQKKTLLWFSFE